MNEHHIRPSSGIKPIDISPAGAGWQYLGFQVYDLQPDQSIQDQSQDREIALIPLAGRAEVRVNGKTFNLSRRGVFVEKPQVLYIPPGQEFEIRPQGTMEVALGSAPAEGRYPLRLFAPDEIRVEVRGGGPARRQVNHVLAPPLPAERLILYEVYVPGGAWSGWPPHCHDGYMDSPYLEEVYYYRIEPAAGFAIHRNYRRDRPFDELFTVRDGDLVLVTEGFHPVAAAPGSKVYFLNYLAGELEDADRARPPFDDPDHAWIKDNWEEGQMRLPTAEGGEQ